MTEALGRVLALTLALALAGCGASPPRAARPPPAPPPVAPPASPPPGPRVATFEDLVARGAALTPLMRATARVGTQGAAARATIPVDRDLCVRALFAASSPVEARFEDRAHARRGDAATGTEGVVPPAGPICVKKGEELAIAVERTDGLGDTPGAALRVVVFVAP